MLRQLLVPMALGLILVPDWASALGRRQPLFPVIRQNLAQRQPLLPIIRQNMESRREMRLCPPQFIPGGPAPMYVSAPMPIQYVQPTIVYSQPCVPAPIYVTPMCCPPVVSSGQPMAPVQVTPITEMPSTQPSTARPTTQPEQPRLPKIELDPTPTPAPPGGTGRETLAVPKSVAPSIEPTPMIIPVGGSEEKLPPMNVPLTPATQPSALPPLPSNNPATTPLPDLPPLTNSTTGTGNDSVPALDLPELPPLAKPSPAVPDLPVIVKSSPLTESPQPRLKIDQYPVVGDPPLSPDAARIVRFYNRTERDLLLTVNGDLLTLPSKHLVKYELFSEFTWQVGSEPEMAVSIPTATPGLELVIRPQGK